MRIEYDSAARLAHLGRVADARAQEARDLQTRRNELSQAISAKRREAEPFAGTSITRDAERLAAVMSEINGMEAERDSLDLATREAANAAEDALVLFDQANAFAYKHGLPRPSIFSSNVQTEAAQWQV